MLNIILLMKTGWIFGIKSEEFISQLEVRPDGTKNEAVSKDHFNRRERKVCAKNAMLKYSYSALCMLCEKP